MTLIVAVFLKKIKNWIIKVQNSDERIKRRYLIISTAITMAVIVGIWLIYLKLAIPSFNSVSQSETNQESEIQFWQVFKNGLKIVGGGIKQNIQNIISQIFKGNIIIVK